MGGHPQDGGGAGTGRLEFLSLHPQRFVIDEDVTGRRLDLALADLATISRAEARRWIDQGRVRLNGSTSRPSHPVRAGDVLEASPREPVPTLLVPEAIPLRILHQDEHLVVVDKPAGMVVHPGPGHPGGTLVNALLHHCGDLAGIGGVLRPGIVHRLDRGTSGALVAAKNDAAHLHLAQQFHDHTIERVYQTLVRGMPGAESGVVDRPIGRHRRDRKRMSVRTDSGRAARTGWQVLRRFSKVGLCWLEVRPETGRTHQIRVHLASAGLPIVGDPIYGRSQGALGLERPALHASVLGFDHPGTGERLRFEAVLPEDLLRALAEAES